jgi:hypothetical protein
VDFVPQEILASTTLLLGGVAWATVLSPDVLPRGCVVSVVVPE